MTNVPNGLEFSYSGDWGAIYAKRYSILFALASTANRDRDKAFSQSMGYGVKSIDSHDLIRPACYALAFVIGVISYVRKMFRPEGASSADGETGVAAAGDRAQHADVDGSVAGTVRHVPAAISGAATIRGATAVPASAAGR